LASICHIATTTVEEKHQLIIQETPPDTTADIRKAIHPVRYPGMTQVYSMPVSQRASEDRLEVHPMKLDPVCLSKALRQIHLDNRRDLADTGAFVSATGRLDILHEFSTRTSYDIMGHDGRKTRTTGQGIAWIQNPITGTVDEMLFVYIPSIQGTIVSLEHHTKTNPNIHPWTQEATPTLSAGCVRFYDANDQILSTYKTVQHKGLYYLQNLHFIPVQDAGNTDTHPEPTDATDWESHRGIPEQIYNVLIAATHTEHDATKVQTGTHGHGDNIDFELPLHTENQPAQLCPTTESNTTPNITALQQFLQDHVLTQTCNLTDRNKEEMNQTLRINRIGAFLMEKDILNTRPGTNAWASARKRDYEKPSNLSKVFQHFARQHCHTW
jgi:hypothetical protein